MKPQNNRKHSQVKHSQVKHSQVKHSQTKHYNKLRRIITLEVAKQLYGGENDCYDIFKLLLLPLEKISGGQNHPEGDALFHSLQVFELARANGYGYDLEFLQAALLHDIGKSIDVPHHAITGAEVLEGFVSPRTAFLICHHMEALELQQHTLGHKKTIALRHSPYYEDLMALREFDNRGRQKGMPVDTIEEALAYLRQLEDGA